MTENPMDRLARATPAAIVNRAKGLSDRAIAWIFVAPTIILLLAINIFPLIWTIYLSFTNYKVNRPNRAVDFIGLRNYERILTDADIWITMQATAHFLIWTIVLQVLIGFSLAYLINKKFKGNDLWTTIIVLPMMLSPAVVGNFWTFLYQPQIGLFNYIVGFDRRRSVEFFHDRRCRAGAVGHRDSRHMDVDPLCHADLPRRSAIDSGLHL